MAGSVALRREAKIASIIEAAWELAREHGIGGLSLHALAREVGMRQPSLYEYFASKHALFDALFAAGNRQLLERLDATTFPHEPRAALKRGLAVFVEFALEDSARSELLFQRHIPGFEPTRESYGLAEEALDRLVELMHDAGVNEQGDVDCLVAVTAGLIDAQMSNDPGGDRWTRHLDRLVDLLVDDATTKRRRSR
ncbi:MAG: TetR/AcrR family transcriptional regulator [Acidimicrobiia bacterium]|nr:TetR/AcrR family transcriptional regulator [Acidimicrobiia bacterium]